MESEISGGLAQAKARLQLGAAAVAPGAELGYRIANDGETPLLYGAGYHFERRTANGWESVPITLAFPAWGARIVPDEDSGAMVARAEQSGVRALPPRHKCDRVARRQHPDARTGRADHDQALLRVQHHGLRPAEGRHPDCRSITQLKRRSGANWGDARFRLSAPGLPDARSATERSVRAHRTGADPSPPLSPCRARRIHCRSRPPA